MEKHRARDLLAFVAAVERPVNVRPRGRFDQHPAILLRVLDGFANVFVGVRHV